MNTKGISGVITTVLLITVAVVAIGIVAMVVINMVNSSKETIDYSQKCLGATFKIKSASLDPDTETCNVVIERVAGISTEVVDGILLTANNDAGTETDWDSSIASVATIEVDCTGVDSLERVDANAYFIKDDSGERHLCSVFSWENPAA